MKAALDAVNSQLPKRGSFKQVVGSVKFNYVGYPMQRYQVLVDIKISQQSTQTFKFYYTPEYTGEHAMKLNFMENDGQATTATYLNAYPALNTLIEAIMRSYKLSAASMLAPNRMTFTAGADDTMVLDVKRW